MNNNLHGRFGYGEGVHCDEKELSTAIDYIQQWIEKNPSEGELGQTWLDKLLQNAAVKGGEEVATVQAEGFEEGNSMITPDGSDPIEEIPTQSQYAYEEYTDSQEVLLSDFLDEKNKENLGTCTYILTKICRK